MEEGVQPYVTVMLFPEKGPENQLSGTQESVRTICRKERPLPLVQTKLRLLYPSLYAEACWLIQF